MKRSMPRISQEHKQYYKSKIRSLLAQNHQITQREMQERLKAEGIVLDRGYLGSLVNSVYLERIHRADRATLNYALAAFEDTMTEIVRVAWDIANNPLVRPFDRIQALKEVREAHNDVFTKLFDAGVFEKKLGTLDLAIRNTPLPEEEKKEIRTVFMNWGLLPPPKENATTEPNNSA
jgi:hypothetical protein